MKIGNTVVEFHGEEGFFVGIIIIIITIAILATCIATIAHRAHNRDAAEKLYCLEHTDLTADECDRLF